MRFAEDSLLCVPPRSEICGYMEEEHLHDDACSMHLPGEMCLVLSFMAFPLQLPVLLGLSFARVVKLLLFFFGI